MSAPIVFVLTSAGAGNGIYQGTFPGGASNGYAGMWVVIAGFLKPENLCTTQITASTATQITTTNTGSLAETHAGTATDFTPYVALDPAGFPETVVNAATSTGSQWSKRFSILSRQGGGPRQLTLQLDSVVGAVSAFKIDVLQSFDGGLTWQILEGAFDLFNSPSMVVSPNPAPGAIIMVSVNTLTGGTSASVIASSV